MAQAPLVIKGIRMPKGHQGPEVEAEPTLCSSQEP